MSRVHSQVSMEGQCLSSDSGENGGDYMGPERERDELYLESGCLRDGDSPFDMTFNLRPLVSTQ